MSKSVAKSMVDEGYDRWKLLVPILYDWFTNHDVTWPSLSCRWGHQVSQATYKSSQRLYFSEQTDGNVPNTLIIAHIEVVKPRVAAAQNISKFEDDARSPFVTKSKAILHPGEVNRIIELPQSRNIVATHTDSPHVFIWDTKSQYRRSCVVGAKPSQPDLILTGHQDNADYALAMCRMEPFVLSGGKDKCVLLWMLHDHTSSLASYQQDKKSSGSNGGAVSCGSGNGSTVQARGIFQGHNNTVEDVQFNPSSTQEFCSVGDDSCLILWDARTGSSPVIKVEKAHNDDIHCVDWNPSDANLILTGSADATVHLYDRRTLTSGGVGSPIHIFEGHTASVSRVQWSPDKVSVFGSAADDGILNIWDHEKIGKLKGSSGAGNLPSPPGLFFQHRGHKDKVVDFHWNEEDPWTIVSASQHNKGGAIQIWRMIDWLYRSEEEVLAELDKHKSHILECSSSSPS